MRYLYWVVHLQFESESTLPARMIAKHKDESWFKDLEKLTNDELMRMYTTIRSGGYEFAKDAWYIPQPFAKDQRCPVMVAKGYSTPDTPQKMIRFQDTAKTLEQEFRGFIDAWDFGLITKENHIGCNIIHTRTQDYSNNGVSPSIQSGSIIFQCGPSWTFIAEE